MHLKYVAGILLLCIVFSPVLFSFSSADNVNTPEENCRQYVLSNMVSLEKCLVSMHQNREDALPLNRNNLKEEYRKARMYYKRVEFFIEYYSPFDAKYYINGAPVKKYDIEHKNKIFDPHGFQVLEQIIFSKDSISYLNFKNECSLLLTRLTILKEYYKTITLSKNNMLEMLKLTLVRIMGVNLNGYDCTINKENITETIYVIESIEKVLSAFELTDDKEISAALKIMNKELNEARTYLAIHPNSDTFNRLHFITQYLNPLYKDFTSFHLKSGIKFSKVSYAINMKSSSLFAENGLNKQFFSLYRDDTVHINEQAQLGKLLFFDPILSGNNKRACASCHQPNKAFTDGLDKSIAFDLKGKADRNAPTLLNVIYQKSFFYDGQVFNPEEQVSVVLHNQKEMNGNANDIVEKLSTCNEYKQLFATAFKGTADTTVSFYGILKAIAEFEKMLDSRNSRFDKYLKGDYTQLSKTEINGYNLFAGKALCGSCHFFPLFNGTTPPFYNDNEFEVIGVPEQADNKKIDADIGRQKVTRSIIHRFAFKTPSIRNIELTAPYMHNGVYKTLDEVLAFYNKGGAAGFHLPLENQTLPFDSLNLSKKELKNIKSFLLCLTDTSALPVAPTRLPQSSDATLNNRKIGGDY